MKYELIIANVFAFALGWCFTEAYIIGPKNHRREARQETMKEAAQRGFAHEIEVEGKTVIVWNDPQPEKTP